MNSEHVDGLLEWVDAYCLVPGPQKHGITNSLVVVMEEYVWKLSRRAKQSNLNNCKDIDGKGKSFSLLTTITFHKEIY